MQQFEINAGAKHQVRQYLNQHQLTLEQAMQDQAHNQALAEILHAGLPAMVKLLYSKNKFITFFWEKRELLYSYIAGKLDAAPSTGNKSKAKKKR